MSKNKKGLSERQAAERRKKFGYNEIPSEKESGLKRLFKKLWSPIPWMIEVAAFISAIIGKWEDFTIIIVLLAVNVFVDYSQESKALNALEALKAKLAKKALVLRDGKFKKVDARYLVPGDIVKLKIGDIVPADAILVEGKYLEVDQSALTGESLPVDKKTGDQVYSNSVVKMGEMLARVTATGLNTFFGKSAALVERAQQEKRSHFQKAVVRIGDFLIFFTIALAAVIMAVSIFRSDSFFEDLQFILVLVVASIPVALPAVLSVAMAVGALSIAKRKAIVSSLPAIEELAGIDILCADKTGTLTLNKMSVGEAVVYSRFTEEDLFLYASLASRQENDDPIERPIFDYLNERFPKNRTKQFKQLEFIPFDPVRKKTEAVVFSQGKKFVVAKGAPQVIIAMCANSRVKNKLFEDVHVFAKQGYRTLAVAVKQEERKEFDCVGLIPLFDPPRPDSARVIKEVKKMGVDVKMLTGDNHAIAMQIAGLLDIGAEILDTSELRGADASKEFAVLGEIIAKGIYEKVKGGITKKEAAGFGKQISKEVERKMSESRLQDGFIKKHESDIIKLIENANGFSQVMPEDKYFIIDKLQKGGHIVAMTGDGVNDAPALKKADVGIAVSGATDAAMAAADLVLLSPGLSVINHAVRIARKTFERMKAYAIFRIAETMRIILFMSLSIIVFNFYPITAIMIVVLALLNDVPVMMIAYDNARVDDKPVRWDMKEVLTVATVLGFTGVASSFLLFYWLQTHNYPLAFIQAMLFIKLDVAGHSTLYLTRAGRHHFWHKPFPSLKFFLPAFGSRMIGTLAAVYGVFMAPIGWRYAGYMWLYSIAWWIFNDFLKVATYKILDKKGLRQSAEKI